MPPLLAGKAAGPDGLRVVGIHTARVRGTLTREKAAEVSGDRRSAPGPAG
jgi:hypothetical protein